MDRYQDRGPTSSASFNKQARESAARVRSVEAGLVDVQNRVNDLETGFAAEAASVSEYGETLSQISASVAASESGRYFIPVCSMDVNVNGSNVPVEDDGSTLVTDPLFVDDKAGVLTLKQTAVNHKLRMLESVSGKTIIHPEVVTGYTLTPGDHAATVNNKDYAVDGKFLRAFMAKTLAVKALEMTYYATVPYLAVSNQKSNMISVELAPGFHCSLTKLQYAIVPSPAFADGAQWIDLPYEADVAHKNRWQPPLSNGTNTQHRATFRRYYLPDTGITAVRAAVKTRMNGGTPVGLDLDGVTTYLAGIRDLDVAHVSFATSGSIFMHATLPLTISSIDLTRTKAICINQADTGYAEPVNVYTKVGGVWTKYVSGALSVSEALFEIKATAVNGISPVISGIDFVYA